ncbi:unnamed protein product [Ascophyllum nodosum]
MSQQSDPERHDHESRTHGKRKRRITLEGKELCARPPLFRLMASPTDTLSVGSVGLADILSGDFHEALLTNYMVDSQILMDAQPRLRHVPWVLVCGDMDNMEQLRQECKRSNPGIQVHRPQVERYGVYHTKMIILKFQTGVRVVVLTANFIVMDLGGKSQGVWYQEFPLRPGSLSCEFEDTLVDYLERVGGPAAVFGRTLRDYDFRSAKVVLVASVPGTGKEQHSGRSLHKYGHMRVREKLRHERVLLKEGGHRMVMQISSLSSLTNTPDKWLMELLTSFMPQELESADGGASAGATLRQHLRVVWPSVEAVRKSTKGWISGVAICAESENIFGGAYNRPDERRFSANDPRPELKPLLRKWDGNPVVNRATDSPHIKSYLRYREAPEGDGTARGVDRDEVAWFLLTSSNLSRSAWGFLDKNKRKLTVRSFELGVMFLPSLLGEDHQLPGDDDLDFTCTPGQMGLTQRFPLTLRRACAPGRALPLQLLPLPYRLPAPVFDFGKRDLDNRPWVRNGKYAALDKNGISWPLPD